MPCTTAPQLLVSTLCPFSSRACMHHTVLIWLILTECLAAVAMQPSPLSRQQATVDPKDLLLYTANA